MIALSLTTPPGHVSKWFSVNIPQAVARRPRNYLCEGDAVPILEYANRKRHMRDVLWERTVRHQDLKQLVAGLDRQDRLKTGVVMANGFYVADAGGKRPPAYVWHHRHEPFAIAALSLMGSCFILTTAANRLVRHAGGECMPVILPQGPFFQWLTHRGPALWPEVPGAFVAYPEDMMAYYAVDVSGGNVRASLMPANSHPEVTSLSLSDVHQDDVVPDPQDLQGILKTIRDLDFIKKSSLYSLIGLAERSLVGADPVASWLSCLPKKGSYDWELERQRVVERYLKTDLRTFTKNPYALAEVKKAVDLIATLNILIRHILRHKRYFQTPAQRKQLNSVSFLKSVASSLGDGLEDALY